MFRVRLKPRHVSVLLVEQKFGVSDLERPSNDTDARNRLGIYLGVVVDINHDVSMYNKIVALGIQGRSSNHPFWRFIRIIESFKGNALGVGSMDCYKSRTFPRKDLPAVH